MNSKVNKIPEDWEIVKLKDVLLAIRNGLITKQNKEGNGYPVTRIETISDEKIDVSKVGYVSDISEEDKKEYKLIEGDILFSHINSREHIGKTAIYEGKPEFLLHGMNLLLLRPDKSKIAARFLLYLLRFFKMKKIFWNMSKKAVNQASINQTELGNLRIILPPIQEQQIIAQILSTLDKAIQKVDEIVAKAERLKKGLMKELLTGKIRVEEKDGKIVFCKETEFKDTEIGKIPKDWKVAKLEDIAYIYSGNTSPQEKKYFEKGKYPFIRVQHLQDLEEGKYPQKFDLVNDLAISELKLRKFKKGSVIFPKSGESIRLEKRAILREDSYVVNHLAVIEPIDTNIIDNLFLFYYLLTIKTSNYLTKTTMPSLNLSIIQKLLIPFPPLIEQQKIAEILLTIDKKLELERKRKEKLERIKKGLMNDLLTGRKRVGGIK
jgi:type I restriction enzyme S subunit